MFTRYQIAVDKNTVPLEILENLAKRNANVISLCPTLKIPKEFSSDDSPKILITQNINRYSAMLGADPSIVCVMPEWISHSLKKGSVLDPKYYNPNLLFGGVVAYISSSTDSNYLDCEKIKENIREYGGQVTNDYESPLITHKIVASNGQEDFTDPRCNEIFFVSFPWVLESVESGRRLSESIYRINGNSDGDKKVVRKDLFHNLTFMFADNDHSESDLSIYVKYIEKLGGKIVNEWDSNITHVVVATQDSPVFKKAIKAHMTTVTVLWFGFCIERGEVIAPESNVLAYPRPEKILPGFQDIVISITNYAGDSRDKMKNLVTMTGARYEGCLTPATTNLICATDSGNKYKMAKEWGMKVSNHLWLEDCIREWKALPPSNPEYQSFSLNISKCFGCLPVKNVFYHGFETLAEDVMVSETDSETDSPKIIMDTNDDSHMNHEEPQSDEEIIPPTALPISMSDVPHKIQGVAKRDFILHDDCDDEKDLFDDCKSEIVDENVPSGDTLFVAIAEKLVDRRSAVMEEKAAIQEITTDDENYENDKENDNENENENENENDKENMVTSGIGKSKISSIAKSDPNSPIAVKVDLDDKGDDGNEEEEQIVKPKRKNIVSDQSLSSRSRKKDENSDSKARVATKGKKRNTAAVSDNVAQNEETEFQNSESSDYEDEDEGIKKKPRISKNSKLSKLAAKEISVASPLAAKILQMKTPSKKPILKTRGKTATSVAKENVEVNVKENVMVPEIKVIASKKRPTRSTKRSSTEGLEDDDSDTGKSNANAAALLQTPKRKTPIRRKGSKSANNCATEPEDALPLTVSTPSKMPAEVSKDFVRITKPVKIAISMTNLTEDHRADVQRLKGRISNNIDECTHLIVSKVNRTEKFLGALCLGIEIVTDAWIDLSMTAGYFIEATTACRLQDKSAEVEYDFKLQESIDLAKQRKLLTGYTVFSGEHAEAFDRIVSRAGGKFINKFSQVKLMAPDKKLIIITGDEKKRELKTLKKAGHRIYSLEALTIGILRQSLEFLN